ncbi:hypothetical protein Tco_0466058 [Tanacetum coccineum]
MDMEVKTLHMCYDGTPMNLWPLPHSELNNESERIRIAEEWGRESLMMTSNIVYFIASFIPLIMEYLVNISKRRVFRSLNEDILKINDSDYQYAVSIKEDMAYPCLHSPKTTKETRSIRHIQRRPICRIEDIVCEDSGKYQVIIDNPNITMEEYIRLEKENLVGVVRSVETKFPTIVFHDAFTSEVTHSCEPTVSPLNDNEIDFRISFDESDDEDYTIIFDKNSFSYKMISANDLKTDLENDNDKVNMPSFPSPDPTVRYFNDLDFFKDFENEFSAIVYNDALTSKSNYLTEPAVSLQHIDEFNLKDETSLSECDGEEQNVLYFNDLFSFNVIYLDDLKSDTDNDDDKINIKQSSGNLSVKPLPDVKNTDVGAFAHSVCWETTRNVFSLFLSSLSSQTVYTAYANPMDMVYSLSGRYPVFIFSTIVTFALFVF